MKLINRVTRLFPNKKRQNRQKTRQKGSKSISEESPPDLQDLGSDPSKANFDRGVLKHPHLLLRTQSSPSVVKNLPKLRNFQDTCHATSIKLEDRRKYALLTPAGHDRSPSKLIASVNGSISVEPSLRRVWSQGSLWVKGQNLTLFSDSIFSHLSFYWFRPLAVNE